MQITSGKVVQGRVELDPELPEGASVTVIASDGDETFEVDAETEKGCSPRLRNASAARRFRRNVSSRSCAVASEQATGSRGAYEVWASGLRIVDRSSGATRR